MAATQEDLEAGVAALEKLVAERPTREEVVQIVENSREEFHTAAIQAIDLVVEASQKGISELQDASIAGVQEVQNSGIEGVKKVVDAIGGIPEKLDNVAEKVNKLTGAYDLGKWVAAIVLAGIGYGIYHISDKLSEMISLLGELSGG